MKESNLIYSENETNSLKFKVARYDVGILDTNILLEGLIKGDYDLCRVRCSSNDEMISSKLRDLGMPFFFSSSIRRYLTPIDQKIEANFNNPHVEYLHHDGEYKDLLYRMIDDTLGSSPIGYYRTPYIKDVVDRKMEIEALYTYYYTNNLKNPTDDSSIVFMRDKGEYVGYFALNKVGNHLESHIGGILKPYRKGGYFMDMLKYIKNYCIKHQLTHFAFGARNENTYVQKLYQDLGYIPIGNENVFHVLSFLSKNQGSFQSISVQNCNIHQVLKLSNEYIQNIFINYEINEIQSCLVTQSLESNQELEFSLPINSENHFVVVAKLKENQRLCKLWYVFGTKNI